MKPAFKAIFFLFLFAAVFGSGGSGVAVPSAHAQDKKPPLLLGEENKPGAKRGGEKSSVFKFNSGNANSKKKRISVEESIARVEMEKQQRAERTRARTREIQLAQMERQKAYMAPYYQNAGQAQTSPTKKSVVQRPAAVGGSKAPPAEIKSEKKSKAPFKFFKGDEN